MTEIHIDSATNGQLDYAVALGLGWVLRTFGDLDDTEKSLGMGTMFIWTKEKEVLYSLPLYHPTTNQAQCGELIDKFEISTNISADEWMADAQGVDGVFFDKSRLIAACKAFLWSKFPDGMIPTKED